MSLDATHVPRRTIAQSDRAVELCFITTHGARYFQLLRSSQQCKELCQLFHVCLMNWELEANALRRRWLLRNDPFSVNWAVQVEHTWILEDVKDQT